MQSDIVQRLQPILRRNGWGNVQEYARHIPFMLEREGLTIVEAAEIARLTEALRAAEERAGLLQDGCVLVPEEPTPAMLEAARDGVILGPKMDELVKRGLRANWKAMIRAALKGPSHDA